MANMLLKAAMAAVVVGYVTCECHKRRVLTYNTGLTTTVYGYKDRRSAVVNALDNITSNVDFMCLQEVWFEEDMVSILDKLGKAFPHHYSTIHHAVGQLRGPPRKKVWWDPKTWLPEMLFTVPCNVYKFGKLLACFGVRCMSAEDKRECMVTKCHSPLYDVSPECRACISMAASGANDARSKCVNILEKYNRMNSPGLLVLSKLNLTNVRYVDFHEGYQVLIPRGYIKAEVHGNDVSFACAHLSSVYPYYYDVKLTKFSSYSDAQADEIFQLNDLTQSHLLLGDLNTGPQRNDPGFPELQGEAPANYELLTDILGYSNPYMDTDGRCTYCKAENPVIIAAGKAGNVSKTIDHIMTSSGFGYNLTSPTRILDQLDQQLSDHFGIQVDVCLP